MGVASSILVPRTIETPGRKGKSFRLFCFNDSLWTYMKPHHAFETVHYVQSSRCPNDCFTASLQENQFQAPVGIIGVYPIIRRYAPSIFLGALLGPHGSLSDPHNEATGTPHLRTGIEAIYGTE